MGKTLTLSVDTVRQLLQSHASLEAWYHELSAGLRAARGAARAPDEPMRIACLHRLATELPEVAELVYSMGIPDLRAPAPMSPAAKAAIPGDEDATVMEPARARFLAVSSSTAASEPSANPDETDTVIVR